MAVDEPVQAGWRVALELIFEAGAERLELVIVPDDLADFAAGRLGESTPLGRALLGRRAGELFDYQQGDVRRVRVIAATAVVDAAQQDATDPAWVVEGPPAVQDQRDDEGRPGAQGPRDAQIQRDAQDLRDARLRRVAEERRAARQRRTEKMRRVLEQVQRTDAMIFASSYTGKWGDYDAAPYTADDVAPPLTEG